MKTLNVDLNTLEFAIVRTGGVNLGRCYNQTNYKVYTCGNPDDTRYDDFCTRTSKQWREEIVGRLPSSNAGAWLGKFESVEGTNICVADAWIRIDSGD